MRLLCFAALSAAIITTSADAQVPRENTDCSLSGIWRANDGSELKLGGISTRSGGAFFYKASSGWGFSGGFRPAGNGMILFEGTDVNGRNTVFSAPLSFVDGAIIVGDPHFQNQQFYRIRDDETDWRCRRR